MLKTLFATVPPQAPAIALPAAATVLLPGTAVALLLLLLLLALPGGTVAKPPCQPACPALNPTVTTVTGLGDSWFAFKTVPA